MEVLERGSGPPLVLLHSSGLGNRQWRHALRAMSDQHRVLAPNFVGYGGSPPLTPDWTLDHDVALVQDLLTEIGQPVHLAGHSYGAWIALQVALRGTHNVRGLTLIEPIAVGLLKLLDDPIARAEIRTLEQHPTFWDDATAGDEAWLRLFIDYWNASGSWTAMLDSQRGALVGSGRKIWREVNAVWHHVPDVDAFAAMTVPTLVAWGAKTTPAARRSAFHLTRLLANARGREVPDAGHMFPVVQGRVTRDLIRDQIAHVT